MQPIAKIQPSTPPAATAGPGKAPTFGEILGSRMHGERLVNLARLATAAHLGARHEQEWMDAGPFAFPTAEDTQTELSGGRNG